MKVKVNVSVAVIVTVSCDYGSDRVTVTVRWVTSGRELFPSKPTAEIKLTRVWCTGVQRNRGQAHRDRHTYNRVQ